MEISFFCTQPDVFKPAPVHYCTDFTSTAIATVSTYGGNIRWIGTLLQAVRVVRSSLPLNTHPCPQPPCTTLPDRRSFAAKYRTGARLSSQSYNVGIFTGV
ncbi:hypothetical protein RF11_00885 [Thelohanellus kitauei]|uniref:Uncharacterized protein n=1 Tax=Thelohanellus kitauei TaxID=669202 RepID=A0A0C2MWZ4_THEKT|nr:hypothetical protein RF11_00885 [Thelohanellus kitauei]